MSMFKAYLWLGKVAQSRGVTFLNGWFGLADQGLSDGTPRPHFRLLTHHYYICCGVVGATGFGLLFLGLLVSLKPIWNLVAPLDLAKRALEDPRTVMNS